MSESNDLSNLSNLSNRLKTASLTVFQNHLEHAKRQRRYEEISGDQSNDPTRVHTYMIEAIKREMGPLFDGQIEIEMKPDFSVHCKVVRGPSDNQVIVAEFLLP